MLNNEQRNTHSGLTELYLERRSERKKRRERKSKKKEDPVGRQQKQQQQTLVFRGFVPLGIKGRFELMTGEV